MTELAYQHRPLTISGASQADLKPVRRLIVLVPGLEADVTTVTQRVWDLASATGAHIKFLSLCNDKLQEPSLRRRLITMTAIVNYDNVSADAEIVPGNNWVEAVKARRQIGDMVVCCAGQRAGLAQKPLSQILQSDLDMPLYILTGIYPKIDSPLSWMTQAAAWIGFLVIIIGFFMLQVRIDRFSKDWALILQLLAVMTEFWLIWVWNSLF
jgi:hypothetical protein